MGFHNLQSKLENAHITAPLKSLYLQSTTAANAGRMLGAGESASPTDEGWGKGAIWLDNANGAFYQNTGNAATAVWSGLGGSTTIIDENAVFSGDVTLSGAVQTGTPDCTIPDLGAGAGTVHNFVFENATQTLTAKILTAPTINAAAALNVASSGSGNLGITSDSSLTGTRALTIALASDAAIKVTTPAGLTTSELIGIAAGTAAQGEVPYYNGTAWASLGVGASGTSLMSQGAGANPVWGIVTVGTASSIADGASFVDAGALDAVLSNTEQTSSAPTLTIPDFAGVSDQFTFDTLATTLLNKVIKCTATGGSYFADNTDPTKKLLIGLDGNTTDKDAFFDFACSDDRTYTWPDASFTVVGKDTTDTFTNKLMTDATCVFGANGALTKTLGFDLSNITAANKVTLTPAAGTACTITIPNGTDTLAVIGGTQSLAAKTLTAPKIVTGDGIFDAGGDELLLFTEATTPANYLTITSADASSPPILAAAGSDAAVNLQLSPKGTGNVFVTDGTDTTKDLNFELAGATTAKTTTFTISHTDDRILTFPDITGTIPAYGGTEEQGDVIYYNGTAWTLLPHGNVSEFLMSGGHAANPSWSVATVAIAAKLTDSFVIESGTFDIVVNPTTQTVSAPTLVIPDFAGANDTLAFLTLAQTFVGNKIFQYGHLLLGDQDDGQTLQILVNEDMTGDKTLTYLPNDGDRTIDLSGNLVLGGTFTTTGAWTQTGAHSIGITTQNNGTLAFADATAYALTFPTGTDVLVGRASTDTLTNKTLTSPAVNTGVIEGGTAQGFTAFGVRSTGAAFDLLLATTAVYGADRTLTINIPTGGNAALTLTHDLIRVGAHSLTLTTGATTDVTLPASGTLATLTGAEAFTDKTLDSSDSWFVKTGATTAGIKFDCSGITGAFFTTLDVGDPLADRILTLPITATTLVGHDTTNTFTNKSFDCDGTSNALTNVNADELDPITMGASVIYGVPFFITQVITNLPDTGTDLYTDNAPWAFRVIGAKFINSSATGGTWALHKGKVGALGNAMTEVVTSAATDNLVSVATQILDSEWDIASSGSLCLVGDVGDAMDGYIIVECIRYG